MAGSFPGGRGFLSPAVLSTTVPHNAVGRQNAGAEKGGRPGGAGAPPRRALPQADAAQVPCGCGDGVDGEVLGGAVADAHPGAPGGAGDPACSEGAEAEGVVDEEEIEGVGGGVLDVIVVGLAGGLFQGGEDEGGAPVHVLAGGPAVQVGQLLVEEVAHVGDGGGGGGELEHGTSLSGGGGGSFPLPFCLLLYHTIWWGGKTRTQKRGRDRAGHAPWRWFAAGLLGLEQGTQDIIQIVEHIPGWGAHAPGTLPEVGDVDIDPHPARDLLNPSLGEGVRVVAHDYVLGYVARRAVRALQCQQVPVAGLYQDPTRLVGAGGLDSLDLAVDEQHCGFLSGGGVSWLGAGGAGRPSRCRRRVPARSVRAGGWR